MRTLSRIRLSVAVLIAGSMLAVLVPLRAAQRSALVIWPIDPVLESGQTAAALWLENRGASRLTLQIRVLGWQAANYDEVFVEVQDQVIASPPIAEVDPGARQLVRLVRTIPASAGREQAFRVLIDELPGPESQRPSPAPLALGVALRLRYSLPLFVYGDGLSADRRPDQGGPYRPRAAAPALRWTIVDDASTRWLHVRNGGDGHARLSGVHVTARAGETPLAVGLLGYVLPGGERRWALPSIAAEDVVLRADVNGRQVTGVRPERVGR